VIYGLQSEKITQLHQAILSANMSRIIYLLSKWNADISFNRNRLINDIFIMSRTKNIDILKQVLLTVQRLCIQTKRQTEWYLGNNIVYNTAKTVLNNRLNLYILEMLLQYGLTISEESLCNLLQDIAYLQVKETYFVPSIEICAKVIKLLYDYMNIQDINKIKNTLSEQIISCKQQLSQSSTTDEEMYWHCCVDVFSTIHMSLNRVNFI
jgi:hypothetical protein